MERREIRKEQWEISELLISSLRRGIALHGQIRTIIRMSGLQRLDAGSIAKFLQRAENMPHIPFKVSRKRSSHDHGCVYRITLKNAPDCLFR